MSGYLDYTHDIQIESHSPEKMSNASDLLKDARKNDKIRPSCFLFFSAAATNRKMLNAMTAFS